MLFSPKIFSTKPAHDQENLLGMHEMVYHSLTKCDADIKSHLTQNIVLTGGNASLPGYLERLNKEVTLINLGQCDAAQQREDPYCLSGGKKLRHLDRWVDFGQFPYFLKHVDEPGRV